MDKHFFHSRFLISILLIVGALLPVFFFLFSQDKKDDDIIRVAHIALLNQKIQDKIQASADLPLPANALDIQFQGSNFGYQGQTGADLFQFVGLEHLKDPVTNTPYHYYLRPDTHEYEIVALLESEKYADFYYQDQPAYSLGNVRGRLMTVEQGSDAGKLVSSVLSSKQTLDLNDPSKRAYSDYSPPKSCQAILTQDPRAKSGKYVIQIDDSVADVYCDMETDGGGWTLWYANNGHSESETQMSYVDMRKALSDATAGPSLADYENPHLAGLLNYQYFIDQGAYEVLLKNRSGDTKKWVKISFSTPATLLWALGDQMLGNPDAGCIDIPDGGTWSIVNQDARIEFTGLTQVMGHGGVNWGVSHQHFWCNGYIGNVHPHLAFYSATSNIHGGRARSNDLLGGTWGEGNEYRYFIR